MLQSPICWPLLLPWCNFDITLVFILWLLVDFCGKPCLQMFYTDKRLVYKGPKHTHIPVQQDVITHCLLCRFSTLAVSVIKHLDYFLCLCSNTTVYYVWLHTSWSVMRDCFKGPQKPQRYRSWWITDGVPG